MPRIVKPSLNLEAAYRAMLEDWKRSGEPMIPFCLRYDCSDFRSFLYKLQQYEIHADEGFVRHSSYWLLDERDAIVGVSNLRHELNDKLRNGGGHIGYGIRPGYRGKGYASELLRLTLIEAADLGIEKALLCCDQSNLASQKTILKNAGDFAYTCLDEGDTVDCYWIHLNNRRLNPLS